MMYRIEVYENILDMKPLASAIATDELIAESKIKMLREKAEEILKLKEEQRISH